MQILIPAEITHGITTAVVVGIAGMIAKFALKGAKKSAVDEINCIVTANANRTRAEVLCELEKKHNENKAALMEHVQEDERTAALILARLDRAAIK